MHWRVPGGVAAISIFMLLCRGPAFADLDRLRETNLKKLEEGKATVFVAQCGSRSDRLETLLFDASSNEWSLYESDKGSVWNAAFYKFKEGGKEDFETFGGLYTYMRIDHLLTELTVSGFDLLAPFTLEKLKTLNIRKKKCKYDDSEYFNFYDPSDPAHKE